jgi:hypothetical protein
MRLALPYLLINFITETYGIQTKAAQLNNYWIYNLSTTIEFAFYYYVYYRTLNTPSYKKIISVYAAFFFPFAIFNMFLIQGMDHFHTHGYLTGSIFLIVLVLLYLREVFLTIELRNPLKEKIFWISTGVLFFYIGSFFQMGFFEYIFNSPSASIRYVFDALLNFLNVILYTMFIIAFNLKNE